MKDTYKQSLHAAYRIYEHANTHEYVGGGVLLLL